MRSFVVAIFLMFTFAASAQSVDELRQQIKGYEAEIARINSQLAQTSQQQNSAAQNLKLAEQKVQNRRKILKNLDRQIDAIKLQLGHDSQSAVTLSAELDQLKASYGELVRISYLNYRNRNLETLIGSQTLFAQSIRNTSQSLRQSQTLAARFHQIDTMHATIQGHIAKLTKEQKNLLALMSDKAKEVRKLDQEVRQISAMSAKLKGTNKQLTQKARDTQQKLNSLQQQIARFIAAESKPTAGRVVDQKLSSVFENNIGKLPAPVVGATIADRFGTHQHIDQAGIQVKNSGINLACGSGSAVRAVFDGEVRAIFPDRKSVV